MNFSNKALFKLLMEKEGRMRCLEREIKALKLTVPLLFKNKKESNDRRSR